LPASTPFTFDLQEMQFRDNKRIIIQ